MRHLGASLSLSLSLLLARAGKMAARMGAIGAGGRASIRVVDDSDADPSPRLVSSVSAMNKAIYIYIYI